MIEIGVLGGASLRSWARFFNRAIIVGLDINPDCLAFATGRVKVEIGSQDDPGVLHRIACRYPPLVVIDDGSHRADHTIFAFERLFPAVEAGGYYIVEDLNLQLLETDSERLRGDSPITSTEYFFELAKLRLGGEHYLRNITGLRRHLAEAIDGIEFISQTAIIKKRAAIDWATLLPQFKSHVAKSGDWSNWLHLAKVLLDQGRPDSEIVEALRTSVTLNGNVIATHERLSEALDRSGDAEGAVAALLEAIRLAQGNAGFVQVLEARLGELRARHGRIRGS
jgi:hypothetical protein